MSKIDRVRPYLMCRVDRKGCCHLFLVFYPSWDSLQVVKEIDLNDDPIYDIKEYLNFMLDNWKDESAGGFDFWQHNLFLVYESLLTRVVSKNASKRWKKKKFFLPFSKKLLYNLGEVVDKDETNRNIGISFDESCSTSTSRTSSDVASRNMRILEEKAARFNDLQFFIDWFEEFKVLRKGSGRKGKITRDKALKIFEDNVMEVKKNGSFR